MFPCSSQSISASAGVTRIEGGDASGEVGDTEEEKREKEEKEEQDDEEALQKARSWDDWKDGENSVTGHTNIQASKGKYNDFNWLIYPSHYHHATWWIIMEHKDSGSSKKIMLLDV